MYASTIGGSAPPTNSIVFPVDEPVKFALHVVPVAGLRPTVNGSTFAVTLILQDGPAS